MRFEELNWMDIEQYLTQDDRVMVVLGATEQHGYLSLATDVRIPIALADAASNQTGVLVAPPINFGCSPFFLAYPGTISLRSTTMLAMVEDVIRSLARTGFKRIVLLNSHSGNDGAQTLLSELADDLSGVQLRWYEWYESHSAEAICVKHNIKPTHANWVEAFSFTKVCDLPTERKTPPMVPGIMDPETARQVYGDGSFGGDYEVDDTIMRELFDELLKDVLQLLRFE